MINIGFDISQLAHNGGVNTYTDNLAHRLESSNEVKMHFLYSSLRKKYLGDLKRVKQFKIPPTLLNILFNNLHLSIDPLIGNVDIFHSSDWIQPRTRAKKVTTFHDLVPIKHPEWSHPNIVKVHKKRLSIVEKEIDMVIAVSKSTKKDLMAVSNIPSEKIVVIYEGVGSEFKPAPSKDIEEFKKKYNLPDRFLLAIGGVGLRRNLERIKKATKEYPLIITGESLPWLPKDQMSTLYSASNALVYPSLYEGFGLPVLEAMACGVPVITSNTSSLPEVGGEAALYVDPYNVKDIESAINLVMTDLKNYEKLVQKGLENVKKFSWKKCADETINVYQKLMN